MVSNYQYVVVGGGAAGITFTSQLLRQRPESQVVIVDPAEFHYYQPAWTLCGGAGWNVEATKRRESECIPKGANWIQDHVESFIPESNQVTLKSGNILEYEILIVAPGIQLDWNKIEGMSRELVGENGICSVFTPDGAKRTWEMINEFEGGNAIFTQPQPPIKCGGAPQKIMYLTAERFKERGISEKSQISFCLPGKTPFGIKEFVPLLTEVLDRNSIKRNYGHILTRVDPEKKIATFVINREEEGEKLVDMRYELLHVVPPQSAPDFVKTSPLADAHGWLDVNKHTLQHKIYKNVFGIGDATSTPNAKTAAAVRKQVPVVVQNICDFKDNQHLSGKYSGYASCPLITGKGKVVLAEFDYDGKLMPSFPLNPAKERYSMWLLKTKFLPFLYWNIMLKGINL